MIIAEALPAAAELPVVSEFLSAATIVPPFFWRRRWPLRHALIVAGIAGAGKTHFIRSISDKRLQPELAKILPAGAERWHDVSAGTHAQWLARAGALRSGFKRLTLHYDLFRLIRQPPSGDPALAIFSFAPALTVVNLRVSPEHAALQLVRREWARHNGLDTPCPIGPSADLDELEAVAAKLPPRLQKRMRHYRGTQPVEAARRWNGVLRSAAATCMLTVIDVAPTKFANGVRDTDWRIVDRFDLGKRLWGVRRTVPTET